LNFCHSRKTFQEDKMRWLKSLIWSLFIVVVALALTLFSLYEFAPGTLFKWQDMAQSMMAGLHKQHIRIGDHDWTYLEGGEGPPVLLLHGFDANKNVWVGFARQLLPNYHVVIPDLPGWGESTRLDSADYGIAAQAARLSEFVTALKLPPVNIAGNSMGGHIAGIFAARYPQQVTSLALLDSAGVHFKPNDFARRVYAGENPFNVDTPQQLDALLTLVFAHPPQIPAGIKQEIVARNIASHAFFQKVLDQIGKGDLAFLLENELGKIQAPTLIMVPRRSTARRVIGRGIAKRPGPFADRIVRGLRACADDGIAAGHGPSLSRFLAGRHQSGQQRAATLNGFIFFIERCKRAS